MVKAGAEIVDLLGSDLFLQMYGIVSRGNFLHGSGKLRDRFHDKWNHEDADKGSDHNADDGQKKDKV